MNTKILTIAFACVISLFANAQNKEKETALLKIGNSVTSLEEFNFIYNKNNEAAQVPLSRNEYYELFVNYKLKAAEAHVQKLDSQKQYISECKHYLNEFSKPYLTDTSAISLAKKMLIGRMNEEIHACHILVKLDNEATPDDTLKAYLRIADARRRILDGEDFGLVASQCSDDPSVKSNNGDLGYFTAFSMVAPFEDAAYNTKVGGVSNIFRSQFGYHFLKVIDRRPFSGEVKVAHIMKMYPRGASPEVIGAAKIKIDSLYDAILNGANFKELAKKYSDDRQTAIQNGEMPWFSENQIIPAFASQAFALKNNGDISKPFQTPFGWHIILRIDRRSQRPINEINNLINRAMAVGHPLGHVGQISKGHQLMKEYEFTWDREICRQVETIILSNEPDSVKSASLSDIIKPMATYDKSQQFTTEKLAKMPKRWNRSATPKENFDRLAVEEILEYEKSKLANKYPEFRYTMQEYYDGLLVFEINQRTIWAEVDVDSIKLAELYNNNKARYSAGGTFDGDIYFCADTKSAKDIARLLKANKNNKASKAKIAKKATHVVSGTQSQNGIYDDYIWPNIKSDYVVVNGTRKDGELLPFEQVRGQLISDYQQIEEQNWIKELRAKYQPKTIGKIK